MNKYELALVVNAKIEDDVRTATVERAKEYITRAGGTFQDSFGGFVMVKSEKLDHESIVANLLKGNYYSSNGAVITQWGFRNGEIYVDCENAERVNFICGGNIGSSRTVMMENNIPLQHVSIPLTGLEQYVRIEVKNTLGQTAWTNPIVF